MRVRVFRQHLPMAFLLLIAMDAIIFFLAAIVAGLLDQQAATLGALPAMLALVFIMSFSVAAMGLYSPRQRARLEGILVRLSAAALMTLGAGAAVFFFLPAVGATQRLLIQSVIFAAIGAWLLRVIFYQVIDEDLFRRRVIVYGAGRRSRTITELRRRTDQWGFKVVAYIRTEGDAPSFESGLIVEENVDLFDYCLKQRIAEIIVAMDDRRRGFPLDKLLACRLAGIEVTDLPDFLEREAGKVRLDVLNPSWLIFGEGFTRNRLSAAMQRTLDISAGLVILMLAWPLMLLAIIAIKIEDGWRQPVLYRQTRVGRDGEHFQILKFRSMRVDAESDGQARWAQVGDARVTRVGGFMRRTRIDELPQILNVLRGDMSIVGPRPERPEFVENLSDTIPYFLERHAVKPGLTGWAQLCFSYGASAEDAAEKLQYDLYYVKNHSLVFDLVIIIQTIEVVLWRKGSR